MSHLGLICIAISIMSIVTRDCTRCATALVRSDRDQLWIRLLDQEPTLTLRLHVIIIINNFHFHSSVEGSCVAIIGFAQAEILLHGSGQCPLSKGTEGRFPRKSKGSY